MIPLISRNQKGGDAGVNPIVAVTMYLEEPKKMIEGLLWLLTRDFMLDLSSIDSGSTVNGVLTVQTREEKAVCLMVNWKWKEKNQPRLGIAYKGITPVVHIPHYNHSKYHHRHLTHEPIRDISYSKIS